MNKKYYHIHRTGQHSSLWEVGKRINWVQKKPNIYNSFFDTHHLATDNTNGNGKMHFIAAMDCFKQQPVDFQNAEVFTYFNLAYAAIKEQGMFIRETIFEEVRKSYFPQLPSRKTCIWVCEKNAVEYWWTTLHATDKRIFELNLTGSTHHADQQHLIQDTIDHDTFRSYAFQYWTGIEDLQSIEVEILFEGVIDILRSFNSIEDFKQIIDHEI